MMTKLIYPTLIATVFCFRALATRSDLQMSVLPDGDLYRIRKPFGLVRRVRHAQDSRGDLQEDTTLDHVRHPAVFYIYTYVCVCVCVCTVKPPITDTPGCSEVFVFAIIYKLNSLKTGQNFGDQERPVFRGFTGYSV